MDKTAVLNLRVDPNVKKEAEAVLKRLGIPMSVAVNLYLHQISLTGGIPFTVTLPKAPRTLDAGRMTCEEINAKMTKGYAEMKAGRVQDASAAFRKFREDHIG
jgi:addiction module RelB/DinJ family antitoxin